MKGEGANIKNVLSQYSQRDPRSNNLFTLGSRIDILHHQDPIIPHVANQESVKLSLSQVFGSLNRLIIDTMETEKLFTQKFLQRQDLLPFIFEGVFKDIRLSFTTLINSCFDPIELLLMLSLREQFKLFSDENNLAILDQYLSEIRLAIIQRIDFVLNLNITSVERISIAKTPERGPHYIIRRYSELLSSVSYLYQNLYEADQLKLKKMMKKLKTTILSFIGRLNESLDEESRVINCLNNYDVIVGVLQENSVQGINGDLKEFNDRLETEMHNYINYIIQKYFGQLKRISDEKNIEILTLDVFKQANDDFKANWKSRLDALQYFIITLFPNFSLGSDIIRLCFTQILYLYQRFEQLIKMRGFHDSIEQDLIPFVVFRKTATKFISEFM
eukprot:TRINITY_DN8239_c0_g1_i1.p1 TRINITY_DN8239_c0_g1~~TRINITY_DN8239_c0_g1_i1.p1  ORF type:complete len:388 (+),score=73.27 TRINITY_DN8239_c0_g1_i1:787-1950(+)